MALVADRIKQAEFVRNIWAVTPEINTKFEDLKKPSYWAHVAAKLHPSDRIEVVSEDSTYFAELYVVSCGRNWAKVSVLRFIELEEDQADMTQSETHKVEWVGGSAKARVVRLEDNAVIKEGFQNKAEAAKWLEGHQKSLLL